MNLSINIKIFFPKIALLILGLTLLILSSCRPRKTVIKPLYGVVSNYTQANLTTSFLANKKNIRL